MSSFHDDDFSFPEASLGQRYRSQLIRRQMIPQLFPQHSEMKSSGSQHFFLYITIGYMVN